MTIIEIGGCDGEDTKKYLSLENCEVWCFEPNPDNLKILYSKFFDNKNLKIIPKAVGDFDGKGKLNIALENFKSISQSSSMFNLSEFSIKNNLIKFIDQIDVDVIRMDTFIETHKIKIIDYLHCDAQGSDLNILKSFGNHLYKIKKGQIEGCNKENMYESENMVSSIIEYLEKNNFYISNKKEIDECDWWDTNIQFYNKNLTTII